MSEPFHDMAPQRGSEGDDPGIPWRVAMQLGAAMGEANREISRPSLGEELATRAAAAARAAVLTAIDNSNADSPGMHLPIVQCLAQQAYAVEWQRLANTPREDWR